MYYYMNPGGYIPPSAKVQSETRGKQLAQAYVPEQKFRELYTAQEALRYGTVFKELNQSYTGKR